MKIEIKNRFTGTVIFSHEVAMNTVAVTLIAAVAAGADLSGADLSGANLYGADLSRANLYGANMKETKNGALVLARTQITPQEGAFVGWKKLEGDVIARLVIPHDAHRFNSYGSRKCRASKVIVHELFLNGETYTGTALDKHTGKTVYATGCEVFPDKFDGDKQVECSHGIHFFRPLLLLGS